MTKRKKCKIFDLSAISIIACNCLQAVICIFVDLFLISRIFKNGFDISQGIDKLQMSKNIVDIGMFYAIFYVVLSSGYAFTGYALRKINKSIFVSIGSVLLTGVVAMIYFLGDKIFDFIPLIAVCYGFGFTFFSSGFNNLTSETISSKHQVRFFAVNRIMFQLTYIIFPVVLGFVVTKAGFAVLALIILAVCAALITFSFLIRPKQHYELSFNVAKFVKKLREKKEETKPLKSMYWSLFFRGASYDCFTTLTTIFVAFVFLGSDSTLGTLQSVFTVCSLITMFFYLRYYRKKRATGFIAPTIALVFAAVIGIICATNKITIILFYAVYVILNVILMSISDSRKAGVVRILSLHSHILESNAVAEFFLAAGRITSSVVLLLAGVFDGLLGGGMLFLKLALGFVGVMYICFGLSIIIMEKRLIKQDEDFKKVHIAENIEKTED